MTTRLVRRKARREPLKETRLFVRREIMQDVKQCDVSRLRDRLAEILFDEFHVLANTMSHCVGPLNLAAIAVETADRREEISLPQVEGE